MDIASLQTRFFDSLDNFMERGKGVQYIYEPNAFGYLKLLRNSDGNIILTLQ